MSVGECRGGGAARALQCVCVADAAQHSCQLHKLCAVLQLPACPAPGMPQVVQYNSPLVARTRCWMHRDTYIAQPNIGPTACRSGQLNRPGSGGSMQLARLYMSAGCWQRQEAPATARRVLASGACNSVSTAAPKAGCPGKHLPRRPS